MGSGEPTAVPANLPVLCAESMLAGRPGRNRNGHALSHGPVRPPLAETKPEGGAPDGAPGGGAARRAARLWMRLWLRSLPWPGGGCCCDVAARLLPRLPP